MSRTWKIVRWVVLGVVVLLIAGGLILYLSLNSIIRSTVESQSEKQLKVEAALDSASLALFGGRLRLSDFTLGSPQGFAAKEMFQVGAASVKVNYGQLRDDPIRIQDITIEKPLLLIEQSGGKLNFKSLLDQLPPPQQTDEPLHLVIERLSITEPTVVLRPGLPGLQEEIRLPLQGITLNRIGTGPGAENGAAVQQVIMQIIAAMADQATRSEKIPAELKALLALDTAAVAAQVGDVVGKEIGKRMGELEKQLPAPATQAVGDVLKQTTGQEDVGKAVEKGLQDLLRGKDGKKSK